MVKRFIKSEGKFPLSKAVLHNDDYTLEISGQIGMDSKTGKLAEGIEKQTIQTMENIIEILKEVGWDINNIINYYVEEFF